MHDALYFLAACGLHRLGLRRGSAALYRRFIAGGTHRPEAVRFFCKSLGLLGDTATQRNWLEEFFRAENRAAQLRKAAPHGLPGRLTVSLTSYPKRFDVLHYTLRSLLNQSMRADAIVLWIAEADRAALPREVQALQAQGVSIRFCDDLRSYKKIIPLLEEAGPEGGGYIVTVDDDTYYPPDWLQALTAQAAARPGAIVAHRAHAIQLDAQGAPRPYRHWNKRITSARGVTPHLIFPTGVGGVLYPPGAFHPSVTDREKFLRLAPLADDVWLYWMWRMNGRLAHLIEGPQHMPVFAQWPASQAGALRASNAHGGGNDEQIRQMVQEFGTGVFKP